MSWVFDTLIWKGRNGYIPAIAQSWSFDADKQAFTFNLNPKAKWHDGRPLISEDVVFTLAYFKKHPYHWISVDKVSRAEAKGLHTVIVYLSKPYAPFLPEIGGTMPVLPKHIWEFVENPEMFNTPQAFIGSGPYRFRDFNKARGTYLYEAFADYYQGPPKADRLIYVRSGKPLISLVTGEVDMAAIQADMAEPLRQNGMIVIKDERGWNRKLMINHRKPPFDSRQFRQALAYAINQKEIIDKAHRGFGTRASYGLLSIDHEMYNPDTPAYPYDTDKAVKIIEFLGYRRSPHGFFSQNGRPLTVELLVSNNIIAGQSVADRDGEVIQKQLEAVGIRVDLVNMEQTTMDTKLKQWKFDLAVSGHGGISGDPRILSEMISSRYGAGSVNSARYDENTELNRLLEEQMREMDPEKRKAIVFKIQELYAWDLPAISLYYPESMTAYAPGKGIEWFYTKGGIGKGIPIAQNKISLIN
ncbi:MAG: ABC transporter substrate-binding protein [Desulfobacterales bacterium]|nr:ABC transporter substrate-binding protein [Desulfobacterales bacterium]MDD4073832.1 ABC transporter substrate-binding protein [Desulfobacterales bacterium]MDD4393746.1 ABC transporter substrate-binding protein [Desulfobacterales bacterium]